MTAPSSQSIDQPSEPADLHTCRPTGLTLNDLPPELLRYVVAASQVHPNEVAGSVKLVCRWTAKQLADYTAIGCQSGPIPPNALMWRFKELGDVHSLTFLQRETVAERAVETGCLTVVRQLLTGDAGPERGEGTLGLAPSARLIMAAARSGKLGVCKLLREYGCPWDAAAGKAAAAAGHTDVCLWLLQEGTPDSMLAAAAEAGHADTVEQLLAAGCPWSPESAGRAAAGGHAGLMQRLLQLSAAQPHRRPTDATELLAGAAEGLELAELVDLHAQHSPGIVGTAAGWLWLHMLRAAALACTEDHQDKLGWLLELGYQAPEHAEPFGLRTSLAWAVGQDASGAGLVSRLAWLRGRGFRLRGATAAYLLSGSCDEPDALAFVLDQPGFEPGAPNHFGAAQAVAAAAVERGHLGSLHVLQQRGWLAPEHVDLPRLLRICGWSGQRRIAAWLVEALCGPGPGQHAYAKELFRAAAAVGSVPLLQLLLDRGCPWHEEAWEAAVWSGCGELLGWIRAHGFTYLVGTVRRGLSLCSQPFRLPACSGAVCAGGAQTSSWLNCDLPCRRCRLTGRPPWSTRWSGATSACFTQWLGWEFCGGPGERTCRACCTRAGAASPYCGGS